MKLIPNKEYIITYSPFYFFRYTGEENDETPFPLKAKFIGKISSIKDIMNDIYIFVRYDEKEYLHYYAYRDPLREYEYVKECDESYNSESSPIVEKSPSQDIFTVLNIIDNARTNK